MSAESIREAAGQVTDPCRDLTEVRWAPYRESGIPDPAAESFEPPAGPVIICAIGYRGDDIIVYWRREEEGDQLYTPEQLDAAAAEIARQMHGGQPDPRDIRMAGEVLTAALTARPGQKVPE
jgi:hypothetical protein